MIAVVPERALIIVTRKGRTGSRTSSSVFLWLAGLLCLVTALVAVPIPVSAQAGMPDARSMSGIPLPVDTLAAGTVVVLVVRGDIANVLKGQVVELRMEPAPRTGKTDETGRAQFTGLAPGTTVRATTIVDGVPIQSELFSMPERGGVRLMLAAARGGATAALPDAAPVPGSVSFGGQSRVIVEFDDDAVQVYYLLDVVNAGRTPVNPGQPLVLDMPPGATDTTVLEGSSPQVSAKGPRVTINGPFAPGTTSVQVACRLPVQGPRLSFSQKLPAAFENVAVMVLKVGELQVDSKQITEKREMPSEGRTYITAVGPRLAAGSPFSLDLSGLPHRSTLPRTIALALAVLALAVGAWAAIGSGNRADVGRRELESRREQVFSEVVRLEERTRSGRVNAEDYRARRGELMAQLERIYGELDTGAGGAGDEGLGV